MSRGTRPVMISRDRTPIVRGTNAPYELPIDDTEPYVAGKRVPEASTRYSDGTLSYTLRPLAKEVVVGAAGNTARRT